MRVDKGHFFPIDVGKVRKIIIDRTACWPTSFNQARGPIPSSLWSIFWLYKNVSERYLERKDFFMSMQAFCFWKKNVPRVTDCRLCVWSRFWWANKIKNNIEKIQREREEKLREEKRRREKIREEKESRERVKRKSQEKESEERRWRCAKRQKSRDSLCFSNDLWLWRVEK